jgi:hypothetical protein
MPKFISSFEKWIKGFFKDEKISSASTTGPISLDGMVFGMPPTTHISDMMVHNSMPVATIIPCEPRFDKGTSLFSLDAGKGWTKYTEVLKSVDFIMSGATKKAIEVAYLADSFPTDTFNNEYGETIFDRMAQGVSSGVGDFSQILGISDAKDLKNMLGSMPGVGGAATGVMNFGEKQFQNAIDGLEKGGHKKAASLGKEMGNSLLAAATGARIDFPMVWKNSSFTPSYSMTIRLWNPNPTDPDMTRKYIVGPIAAILSMALPKVGGPKVASYKWPMFCKVISPGLFNINAGFISNVSIIKGGEQQNIAYNQSLGLCDVRIEFGSLYTSMIAGKGSEKYSDRRPTLGSYLEVLGGKSFNSLAQQKQVFKGNITPINLYETNKKSPSIKTDTDRKTSIPSRIASVAKSAYDSLMDGWKSYAGDMQSDE